MKEIVKQENFIDIEIVGQKSIVDGKPIIILLHQGKSNGATLELSSLPDFIEKLKRVGGVEDSRADETTTEQWDDAILLDEFCKALGTYPNELVYSMADKCVGVAKRYFKQLSSSQDHSPSQDNPWDREWISVKDKLPENEDEVLVFTKDGDYKIGSYSFDDLCFFARFIKQRVTYWKPLLPPKSHEPNQSSQTEKGGGKE